MERHHMGRRSGDAAARKLIEIANSVEAVQDGRIHIELLNGPMLFRTQGRVELQKSNALADTNALFASMDLSWEACGKFSRRGDRRYAPLRALAAAFLVAS